MSDSIDNRPDNDLNQGAQDVVRILRWFFGILTVIMLACVAYYFVSGMYILEAGENAAVFRFGAWKTSQDKEDWYWAMPKYIDRVEEVSVSKRHSFESNYFWYAEDPRNVFQDPSQAAPAESAPLAVGKDGYHLTADNNIMHSKWSLLYVVDDIKAYLTRYDQPKEAVHLALKNAVVKASGQLKIDEILSDRQGRFRLLVKEHLSAAVSEMNIGIRILEVNLLKKSVPRATVEAFNSVTNAGNERDKYEKDARGYAGSEMEKAAAAARKILEEARTYRQSITNSVVADAEYMKKVLPQYRKFGASILLTEYADTLLQVLDEADQVQIVYPGQEVRVTFEPRMDVKTHSKDDKHPGGEEY